MWRRDTWINLFHIRLNDTHIGDIYIYNIYPHIFLDVKLFLRTVYRKPYTRLPTRKKINSNVLSRRVAYFFDIGTCFATRRNILPIVLKVRVVEFFDSQNIITFAQLLGGTHLFFCQATREESSFSEERNRKTWSKFLPRFSHDRRIERKKKRWILRAYTV